METDCHALNDRFIKAPSYPPQLHHLRKALPLPQRARNDYRMALRPLGASKAVHRRAEEVYGSKKMGGSKNRMNADEIVRALRENAEWCDANEYEVPICMGDNQRAAADLIESLTAQLAESRRRERAAIKDLSQDAHCTLCKHHLSEGGDCIGMSMCAVKWMRVGWEWRGPQQAGEGEQ